MSWLASKPVIVAAMVASGGAFVACSSDPHEASHDASVTTPTGCAAEARADAFAIGLTKALPSGHVVRIVGATPAPPAKGDNAWTVELIDGAGKPVSGATIVVTPFMPDHGHGTATAPTVTPEGAPGKYSISKMNLPMAGYWDVTLSVTIGAAKGDARFGICLDG
jgi:hypothetical protein